MRKTIGFSLTIFLLVSLLWNIYYKERSIVNAFICELESTNHNHHTPLEFHVDFIHKLVESCNGRKDQGSSRINPLELRFTERHFPELVPYNEMGRPKERECAVCKAAGRVK